jgi:large subunit ribosomal protein L1
MPRSKKYLTALKLVDSKKLYSPEEAIELVKKTSITKFDATVEIHCCLGINPNKNEQQVRGSIVLPHGIGKTKIVAAFVEPGREKEAKEAGADIVGGEELINKISSEEKIDFDIAVATPAMMPKLAKVAKILGPKGLMPNPKDGTVNADIKKAIEEIKKGKIIFKNDEGGNVHLVLGKVSFETQKLLDNFFAFLETLKKLKPPGVKGTFIKGITLSSTMGPPVKVLVP